MPSEIITVLVFAVMSLLPATMVVLLVIVASRHATPSVGRCRRCGYDLHYLGDTRRCPECGMRFRINEAGDIIS